MVDLVLVVFLLGIGVKRVAFAGEGIFAVMMGMHELMQEFGCFFPDGRTGVYEIVGEQRERRCSCMPRIARARTRTRTRACGTGIVAETRDVARGWAWGRHVCGCNLSGRL